MKSQLFFLKMNRLPYALALSATIVLNAPLVYAAAARQNASTKATAPKQEAPKQEAPKQETPKQEAPKQESPKQS